MKTKQLILIATLIMATKTNAQIKVFSGGSVTIGGTTAPYSVKHQIIGDKTVFSATSSTISSAPLIIGLNTFSSSPGFTFWGDDQTGIAHPGSSILAITIANSEKFRFNTYGQALNSNTTSSASTPDFSWNSDDNTGIFRPSADILAFSTNGSERFRLGTTGNVIIGQTSDDGARLIVNAGNTAALTCTVNHASDYGQAAVVLTNKYLAKAIDIFCNQSGTLNETFKVWGAGDVWGKSWTSWSDKNLKENIDSLPNALSKIKQLKGVKYNYKASFVGFNAASKTEIGLIAQDVELVVPEVVNTDEKGMKGIMYQNLVPLLIEAIKEQNKQIILLQDDVNNCCTKNSNRLINSNENNNETENSNGRPEKSFMKQNVPNPFNKETIIEFFITEKNSSSSMLIFDMTGKLLKTFRLNGTGIGSVTINGNDLRPGMYYYSLIINNSEIDTKKMILTE